MPSVFGARRRLTTSATATTYGHSARSSHNPRRDGHRDALPFLYLPRPLPCGSGDRRRAAQRSLTQTPVPVPPGSPGFPDRDTCFSAPPPRVAPWSTSGDQRARVRGPSEGRVFCRTREPHFCVLAPGACASKSACGRRSLPQRPLDIRCRRCVRREGRRPVLVAGPNQDLRSDADPRRSTPSRRPGCLPPLAPASGVHPSDCSAKRILRVGPSLTPPTRSPHVVERCLHGHCKHQSAVTRDPWHSRNRSPLLPKVRFFRICCVPGTDDPSAPFGSTVVARLRELIALLVPTPDAAPRRLLRPRARGPMCRELHERFMPDPVGPRNKNNRAKSLLLSTELSTGTTLEIGASFTAPLVLRGQITREIEVANGDVDNNLD